MNILYVGDVMGEMGVKTVEKVLPKLRHDKKIDLVIAQAENVSDGKGVTMEDFKRLRRAGIDFCTGGNWSLHHEDILAEARRGQLLSSAAKHRNPLSRALSLVTQRRRAARRNPVFVPQLTRSTA